MHHDDFNEDANCGRKDAADNGQGDETFRA